MLLGKYVQISQILKAIDKAQSSSVRLRALTHVHIILALTRIRYFIVLLTHLHRIVDRHDFSLAEEETDFPGLLVVEEIVEGPEGISERSIADIWKTS